MKNKKLIHVFFLAIVTSSCSVNKDLKFNRDIIAKINNTQKRTNDETVLSSNIHFKNNYYNNFVNKYRTPAFFVFRNLYNEADTIYVFEQLSKLNNYIYGYLLNEDFEGITYQYEARLDGWKSEVKAAEKSDDYFTKYKILYRDFDSLENYIKKNQWLWMAIF